MVSQPPLPGAPDFGSLGRSLSIATVVQHDPRRADLLPGLLAELPADTIVVADPGANDTLRSPWRCYRACLEALPDDASHLVVIQDDAQVCLDFPEVLERVVAARPDDPIALFTPGVGSHALKVMEACRRGQHWCDLERRMWVPVVAICWPRDQVGRVLAFADRKQYPASRWGDDSIIGDYAREEGVTVKACVPSIVEHSDVAASLVGTAAMGGKNPARIAACWAGRVWSPLAVSW